MQEKAKEPEIRFAGFTGAWEQRKAKDLFAAYSDKGHPDLDVLSATQDRGMVRRDDNNINISHDKKNEATYKRVLPGQFVIHLRSFQGGFAYSSIEGITSPAYTVFGFSKPQEHEPNFWKFVFSSEQFIKRLEKVTYGIRDGRSISYDEVLTLSFTFPGKNEQIQIAHFLDKVGALITLHQRKYEKLLNIKKSMLEKMFPKEGEVVPEIRFKGFTGAWEQRKIGDYLTLSKIPGHTGVDAKKLTVKLWGKGVVEKTDIYGGSQNTQYYVRRAGQFMYGKLDFLHAAFGIVPKSLDRFESTLDSPAFDLHEIDGAFLQNRVTQQNFYLKFGNIANGSRKAKRIHEVTFLDMPIVVPSYAEQKKIGAFLNKLDSLLTLHQRKLEMLKNVKQAFLEKMFV